MSVVKAQAKEAAVAARVEAEKTTEDEFAAGFFQGYFDLKRRLATNHPEWDLSVYSVVDSDYWEAEVSAEGAEAPTEVGARSA